MKTKRLGLYAFVAFMLATFFRVSVQARGGAFSIEPAGEAEDTIKLSTSDSAAGNVSVNNGMIDFYVTSPSESVILCCNRTAFESFNFTAEEEGVYVLHLANNYQDGNVTATLDYIGNFNRVFHLVTTVGFNVGTETSQPPPISPWTIVIQIIPTILDQLPRIRTLYEEIKPPENPFPLPEPIGMIFAAAAASLFLAMASIFRLKTRYSKTTLIQTNPRKLGLTREKRKIKRIM